MAFRLPNFPLFCDVYDSAGPFTIPTTTPRMPNVRCQLRYLKIPQVANGIPWQGQSSILLLVDPFTDIRMNQPGQLPDWIECPPGTGRWYTVSSVDDIAKGFSNEHRAVAMVSRTDVIGTWPIPYA